MRLIKLGSEHIFFGKDAVKMVSQMRGDRKKAFIVMSGTILDEVGLLKKLTDALEDNEFTWMTYDEVEPEPSFNTILKGVKEMKTYNPDWVIGFGGGSAMDAAKAMWVYYENDDYSTLQDSQTPQGIEKLREKAKLCCIPTSAGTGSEVTRAALVVDTDTKRKYSIRDMNGRLVPDIAIIDAIFTETMPRSLVAASGMDVITHAIESYVCTTANVFSDTTALGSLITAYNNLEKAYNDNDFMSRENMLAASALGGIAFSNSGLGIVHSIAHSIGAEYGIPHGLANALVLPYGIDFNSKNEEAYRKYNELARILKVDDLSNAIRELNIKLKINKTLSELVGQKLFEEDLNRLVDKVMADVTMPTNPRQPSKDEVKELLKTIYYG